MLSRLKVRTKLLAILLPLLLGVGGLAALGVVDRLGAQSDAEREVTLLEAVGATADVVNQLELEQIHSAATQAGVPIADPGLDAVRAGTDDAVRRLRPVLGSLAGVEGAIGTQTPTQLSADLTRQLDAIEKARGVITPDFGSVQSVADNYSAIIDRLVAAGGKMSQAIGGQGSASSVHWLSAAKATDARIATDVIAVIAATDAGVPTDATWAAEETRELLGQSRNFYEVFTTEADDFGRQTFDRVLQSPEYAASQAAFGQLAGLTAASGFSMPIPEWVALNADRQEILHRAEATIVDHYRAIAQVTLDDLRQEVRLFLGGSATALLVALLLAAMVTRSITVSLGELTRAARTISEDQLPRLVESLKSPTGDPGLRRTEIDINTQDEFAELAAAFGAVEQAAIDVAAEQSRTLRKGISDIFVNLARRNQSLLDRQIEFIDRLESNEEDPDQLENLFRLDHLATRMRRNAESLLVLAGAEGPRRRASEVGVADIVRVAVGEVEDFARITLLAMDDAKASGTGAVDVAHLLAELMENGTQYSPPDRPVEVVGHRTVDGGYVVTVSDQGVGMSPEAMAEANRRLAEPPVVGLSLSRSLGFVVVATLAARHGIEVRLTNSASGGVSAVVTLPPALMVGAEPAEALPAVPTDLGEVPVGVEAADAEGDWSPESLTTWSWDSHLSDVEEETAADTGRGADDGPVAPLFPESAPAAPAEPVGPAAPAEPVGPVGSVGSPPSPVGAPAPAPGVAGGAGPETGADGPARTPRIDAMSLLQPDPYAGVRAVVPDDVPADEAEPAEVAPGGLPFDSDVFSLLAAGLADAEERGEVGLEPGHAPEAHLEPLSWAPEPTIGEGEIAGDWSATEPLPHRASPDAEESEPADDPGAWSATDALPRRVVPDTAEAPPSDGGASDATTSLPRRTPRGAGAGAAEPSAPSTERIAPSNRPAEEIRSILSSYRSGLSSGRQVEAADRPTPDDTEH